MVFLACRKIKETTNIPVIMLSARTEEYDKLFGFELGVDDYVVKPFSPKELMARIKVVLERGKHTTANVLKFDGLEIDAAGRNVMVDGEKAI
jgi:two-component system response regulator ResD